MGLKEAISKVNKAIDKAAKLTTKTRKALPGKVFCGPGRSFPTQDCAHVRAAKVYLKRSHFSPSTQAKIAACINRRHKSLGCGGKTPAKGKGALMELAFLEYADLTLEEQKLFDSKAFESTRKLVDKSIENEGLELDFSEDE